MVRFLVHFTASRSPGTEDEADEFCENFLGFLLNLATAKDRAIRFRVCQLVAGVLNALGVEAEISDDLYERMEEVMLDRLRDKVPVVRAQAARALSRLQDGGEDGNFSDDVITTSFITLLGAEKNKDVRKSILGSLAISDYTIPHVVERTRHAFEDVRRVAFLALTSKVPVASVSIALRAAAVRRAVPRRVGWGAAVPAARGRAAGRPRRRPPRRAAHAARQLRVHRAARLAVLEHAVCDGARVDARVCWDDRDAEARTAVARRDAPLRAPVRRTPTTAWRRPMASPPITAKGIRRRVRGRWRSSAHGRGTNGRPRGGPAKKRRLEIRNATSTGESLRPPTRAMTAVRCRRPAFLSYNSKVL